MRGRISRLTIEGILRAGRNFHRRSSAMSSSEESVGIRAWANDLPGFTGILKQRCAVLYVVPNNKHDCSILLVLTTSGVSVRAFDFQHSTPGTATSWSMRLTQTDKLCTLTSERSRR